MVGAAEYRADRGAGEEEDAGQKSTSRLRASISPPTATSAIGATYAAAPSRSRIPRASQLPAEPPFQPP